MNPEEDFPESLAGDTVTATRRYDLVIKYLATDNSIFWTRSQIMLVANITLLGFAAGQVKDINADLTCEPWTHLGIVLIECVFGMALCIAWYFVIKAGIFWMERWERILRGLERMVFGNIEFIRCSVKRPKPSSRNIARWSNYFFSVIWAIMFIFVVATMNLKRLGWKLP